MTSRLQLKSIDTPVVYHREYEYDFPPKEEVTDSFLSECLRVSQVALPFLSLYSSLGQPISVMLGFSRVTFSFFQMIDALVCGDAKVIGRTVLEVAIATTALVCSILAHPLGMLVTTSHDMIRNILQLVQALQVKDYKKAAEIGIHLLNNALYLGCFFAGSIEMSIASIGSQIFLGIYHSCDEFRKGNYLEGFGHILMAGVRGKQMHGQVRMLQCQQAALKIIAESVDPNQEKSVISKASNISGTASEQARVTYVVALVEKDGLRFHVADYPGGLRVITEIDDGPGYQGIYENGRWMSGSRSSICYWDYCVHQHQDVRVYSFEDRQIIVTERP